MTRITLWESDKQRTRRLEAARFDLEAHLEGWIEADPSLIQPGLTIVGRQLALDAGRLDLLGIDPTGRWVLVEVKRGRLHREALAQIFDYAAAFSELQSDALRAQIDEYLSNNRKSRSSSARSDLLVEALQSETRELQLVVVGSGKSSSLDRLSTYLVSKYSFPLTIVSFDVFEGPAGSKILARETIDAAQGTESGKQRTGLVLTDLFDMADKRGIGRPFRAIVEAGTKGGLYPRLYSTSVMLAPQVNRSRALVTVWAKPENGDLIVFVAHSAWRELLDVPERAVRRELGSDTWQTLTGKQALTFARGLGRLCEMIGDD